MGKHAFYSCYTTCKAYGSDKAIRQWLFDTSIYEALKNYFETYKTDTGNEALEFITEADLTSKKFDAEATVYIDILNGHSSSKRTSIRPKLDKLLQSEEIDTIHILAFTDLGDTMQEVINVFKSCNQAKIGLMSYDWHQKCNMRFSNTLDVKGKYSEKDAIKSGEFFINSLFPITSSIEAESIFEEMRDAVSEQALFQSSYDNVIDKYISEDYREYIIRKLFLGDDKARKIAKEKSIEEAQCNQASIDYMSCISMLKIPAAKGGRKKAEVTENLIAALFLYESYQISMDAAKRLSGYSLNGFTIKCRDIETHPANQLMEYKFPDGETYTTYADIQVKWLDYYLKRICNMDSTGFWKDNLPKRMGLLPMTAEEITEYEAGKSDIQELKKKNKLSGAKADVPRFNPTDYCKNFILYLGGNSTSNKYSNTFSYQACRRLGLPLMTFIDAKRYEKKYNDMVEGIRQRIQDEIYPLDEFINEYIDAKAEIPFANWYLLQIGKE